MTQPRDSSRPTGNAGSLSMIQFFLHSLLLFASWDMGDWGEGIEGGGGKGEGEGLFFLVFIMFLLSRFRRFRKFNRMAGMVCILTCGTVSIPRESIVKIYTASKSIFGVRSLDIVNTDSLEELIMFPGNFWHMIFNLYSSLTVYTLSLYLNFKASNSMKVPRFVLFECFVFSLESISPWVGMDFRGQWLFQIQDDF